MSSTALKIASSSMLRIIHTDIDFPLLRGAHSQESEVTSTYDQITDASQGLHF